MKNINIFIVLFFSSFIAYPMISCGQNDSSKITIKDSSKILVQDSTTRLVKDTTALADLDYDLTKQQFIDYYGIDDTARAVINMYYRKRGMAGITYCLVPGLSGIVGYILDEISITGLALAGILRIFNATVSNNAVTGLVIIGIVGGLLIVGGVLVVPLIATVNRANYSRQKLIYALVNRERGKKLPAEIIENLKPSDF